MDHEKREGHFFTWYTAAYTPAILLGTANNLFTLYMAYEWLTLCTVPLVWHARDAASERAAVRYLLEVDEDHADRVRSAELPWALSPWPG